MILHICTVECYKLSFLILTGLLVSNFSDLYRGPSVRTWTINLHLDNKDDLTLKNIHEKGIENKRPASLEMCGQRTEQNLEHPRRINSYHTKYINASFTLSLEFYPILFGIFTIFTLDFT